MKPCAENPLNCRGIPEEMLPPCPARDVFLQMQSTQAQQQLHALKASNALKAAVASLKVAFDKAEKFYDPKGDSKGWSNDPSNTAVSDPRWNQYDALRAATEKEAGKVRALQEKSIVSAVLLPGSIHMIITVMCMKVLL